MQTIKHPLAEATFLVTMQITQPLLGTQPTKNIALEFVRQRQIKDLAHELSKNNGLGTAEATRQATVRVLESTRDLDPEGESGDPLHVNGFPADERGLHLWDYQIKGMLKGASQTLGLKVPGKTKGTASAIRDIQSLLWVYDRDSMGRKLPLRRDGKVLSEPDRLLERPLRAQTMQGPRVSIAVSECLDPPVTVQYRVVLLRGCRLTAAQLEEVLSYGDFEGMGGWRSGGWGRFEAKVEEL